ncbi:MAG: hypothetical protein DME85_04450 [Verrucomicrobia bacterium]|nr:MAG: hypothetical protein DME85_04450 [Verrucomicrobiota bacterium]
MRKIFILWLFSSPKIAAIIKNSTDSPRTLFGVTAIVADCRPIIESVLIVNNESWPNAIPHFGFRIISARFGLRSTSQRVKNFMGQQHRVQAKRKRHRAYLKRKKAALRAMRHERPRPRARKEQTPVPG